MYRHRCQEDLRCLSRKHARVGGLLFSLYGIQKLPRTDEFCLDHRISRLEFCRSLQILHRACMLPKFQLCLCSAVADTPSTGVPTLKCTWALAEPLTAQSAIKGSSKVQSKTFCNRLRCRLLSEVQEFCTPKGSHTYKPAGRRLSNVLHKLQKASPHTL